MNQTIKIRFCRDFIRSFDLSCRRRFLYDYIQLLLFPGVPIFHVRFGNLNQIGNVLTGHRNCI